MSRSRSLISWKPAKACDGRGVFIVNGRIGQQFGTFVKKRQHGGWQRWTFPAALHEAIPTIEEAGEGAWSYQAPMICSLLRILIRWSWAESLSNDIAMTMQAESILVLRYIPRKSQYHSKWHQKGSPDLQIQFSLRTTHLFDSLAGSPQSTTEYPFSDSDCNQLGDKGVMQLCEADLS